MHQQANTEVESQATSHVEAQHIITEYEENSAVPPTQDANFDLQPLINKLNMLK